MLLRCIPLLAGALATLTEDVNFKDVFHHVCERDSMYAYIKADDLAKLGSWKSNFESLTLNKQACGGISKVDGNVIFHAGSFAEEPLECDTQYSNHYGKVSFWNMVQYTPPDDSVITRDTEGLYNFSCTYNMTVTGQSFELSLGHKVSTSPIDKIHFGGKEGKGNFSASMELFKDETFTKDSSYVGSGVTLSLEQYLFIEVKLDAADKDIALKILECWATPSANAGNRIRHTLIKDGCKSDETVDIMRSGIDLSGRWKTQMFTFLNEDEVWLHCDIQACDSRAEDCSTHCLEEETQQFSIVSKNERSKRDVITISMKKRRRRSLSPNSVERSQDYEPNILTVGPIINGEREKIQKQKQVGPIIGISVVGAIVAVIMAFGIFRLLGLKRAEEEKIIEANTNNQISADWNLYSSDQKENHERKNPMLVY